MYQQKRLHPRGAWSTLVGNQKYNLTVEENEEEDCKKLAADCVELGRLDDVSLNLCVCVEI